MREVINVQIGQCGNGIGTQFWELLCLEHGLDPNGYFCGASNHLLDRIDVYFTEARGLRYHPRSVMIDLDKRTMDLVQASPFGKIFKRPNFIHGTQGAANNWAKGHLTEGAELAQGSLEIIRREVEGCDCFHGFQILHSIGGGTGGGLGSLLISKMAEEYPGRIISTCSVFPSLPDVKNAQTKSKNMSASTTASSIPNSKAPDSIIESYNSVLTINHLIESAQETHCMDNEALYFIVTNALKMDRANFCDINYLISLALSGMTSCIRFSSPAGCDFRKIAVNMVPFPRLHFFIPGFSPASNKDFRFPRKLSVGEIISQLFNYTNLFSSCDVRKGKFLTVSCIFRGQLSMKDLEKHLYNTQSKNSSQFVEWIPTNVKTALCSTPAPGLSLSATFIGNSTSIQNLLQHLREVFQAGYKRKAFLHWYKGEGLEEMEFEAADQNLNDLANEYGEMEAAAVGELPTFDCKKIKN